MGVLFWCFLQNTSLSISPKYSMKLNFGFNKYENKDLWSQKTKIVFRDNRKHIIIQSCLMMGIQQGNMLLGNCERCSMYTPIMMPMMLPRDVILRDHCHIFETGLKLVVLPPQYASCFLTEWWLQCSYVTHDPTGI